MENFFSSRVLLPIYICSGFLPDQGSDIFLYYFSRTASKWSNCYSVTGPGIYQIKKLSAVTGIKELATDLHRLALILKAKH